MAQNGSGAMTINGVTRIVDEHGDTVNPLVCVAESTQQCDFNPTSTPFTLQLVQPLLPPVRMNPVVAESLTGSISRDTSLAVSTGTGSSRPFLSCTESSPAGEVPTSLRHCPGGKVTINAALTDAEANLPRNQAGQIYCRVGHYGAQDSPEPAPALHCNLSQLDYSQLVIRVVGTESRALRLYFPQSGEVLRSTGGGLLEHGGPADRFALFGCSSCAAQAIKLAGAVAGLHLFAWFPMGTVTVAGSSAYQGVLWANQITSSGGVDWTIPSTEVLAALQLIGSGLEDQRNPPVYDWVARSVRAFRWVGL